MNDSDKKSVLIVDDEPDIRDVLAITLQDMGYRTLEAENAARAFDAFRAENPQIVVTDIKMPGGDGIELLRKIKHENPETEVIMITGHGDMNLAIRSLKYRATDFITKPINVDALDIAIRRALEKIDMRARLQDYTRNLERLVREKTELQDHLASLGLMIGSISHGMKGLLTSLDGGLYLVASGLKKQDLERAAQGCQAARETAERIRKMVLDILYYAKERELKRTPVKVRDFAEELVRVIQPRIESGGIDLQCRFEKNLGTMAVDADYLQAALVNILDNAVDACLKNRAATEHRIDFSVSGDGGEILFRIADNGIGMDEETCKSIFDLFYSTKGRKGTGLGLFIANRVVGQHEGTITVFSTVGKGTEFKVTIPESPAADG
ncbi:hybrid sensor histidine kinase/response regulator [uncultured Desulfosarcina sp.]|uniref:sensor histidine kinase n=1 Tax=uncultured Desulfosarcina sp. TaxID=218289 RepID=UPI0029C65D9F|nr:hybrid sensor histidine kinase/response regulator [uncultured Desulfosarcina sp.]